MSQCLIPSSFLTQKDTWWKEGMTEQEATVKRMLIWPEAITSTNNFLLPTNMVTQSITKIKLYILEWLS